MEAHGSHDEQMRGFWTALRILKGFFRRLIEQVSLTEEDLVEAGVYLHHTRE